MLLFNSALCESMGVYACTLINDASRNVPAYCIYKLMLSQALCVWHVGLECLNSVESWSFGSFSVVLSWKFTDFDTQPAFF